MSCERVWLVVAVVLGYLGAGGLLFQALGPPPRPTPSYTTSVRHLTDACLSKLWAITERLNVLYERNWTRLVHAELRQLENQIARVVRTTASEQEVHWSFSGSLLYSLTVITTIGCGNLGPKTTEGKLATMVYALVGVPLMLVCFSHLGSVLARLIQSAYSALCGCSSRSKAKERLELEERRVRGMEVVGGGCGRAVCRLTSLESVLDYPPRHDSEEEDSPIRSRGVNNANETPSRMPLIWRGGGSGECCDSAPPPPPPEFRTPTGPLVPPVLALALIAGYLVLGAWFFAASQERAYLDGLYFAFTALTTIGLTDPRPSRRPELHLLAVCLYILVGLVVVATAFALVQEQVVSKTRQIAVSLGVVKKEELPKKLKEVHIKLIIKIEIITEHISNFTGRLENIMKVFGQDCNPLNNLIPSDTSVFLQWLRFSTTEHNSLKYH